MLRRSSRINNNKMFKTEKDDDQTGIAMDCVGGGSSGSVSAEVNPLQNVVILHHLFEICPLDQLATFRLVCKQWYEESLLTWRKSFQLRFMFENGNLVMLYVASDGAPRVVPLQDFLQIVADPKHQLSNKPYRNIQIKDSTIGSGIANKKQFEVLWNAFGGNLTTLELKNCEFPDLEEFRQIIFGKCPNLQRLIIDKCDFPSTWDSSFQVLPPLDYKEQPSQQNKHLKFLKIVWRTSDDDLKFPISWLEIFNHFPLISSLSIRPSNFVMPEEEFDSLIKAIRIIRKRDGNLLLFKYFDIGGCGFASDPDDKQKLIIFQELRLPIHQLAVFKYSGTDEGFFRDTIAFCAKTLKDLQLKAKNLTEFPYGHQLDNLKILLIEEDCPKYLALLNNMPNLEKLRIFRVDVGKPKITISNTDIPEPTHLKMMKLTRLELRCRVKSSNIAKLHAWMPNVTHLTVDANDKQFRIVCEKWKNLKSLSVLGKRLTDEGVAGMRNKKGADITTLQNLLIFRFESPRLSAKSVFNGFLQLPNVRVLHQFGNGPVPVVRWGERTRRAILDRKIRLVIADYFIFVCH